MFGCCNFRQILASRSSFWKSAHHTQNSFLFVYSLNLLTLIKFQGNSGFFKNVWNTILISTVCRVLSLPRDVNFLVFIIFAANSNPVDFCTHRLTMEKAPLWKFENLHLQLITRFPDDSHPSAAVRPVAVPLSSAAVTLQYSHPLTQCWGKSILHIYTNPTE